MNATDAVVAVITVLLSGVIAAVVSAERTGRWERKKTLLERRLTGAADFAGDAGRASNALDGLAEKIRPSALPQDEEIEELLRLADEVREDIGKAVERAGLVRVL